MYVKVDSNSISVFQDVNGSYGIYLYNSDDYFAFSNSFIKLVEYLKTKCYLTLNDDYAKSLMSASLCSVIYDYTLVNEITYLPRNRIIRIDKTNKKIFFEKINYHERIIKLDSKEGLDILDNWFYKWVDIIRNIKKKTNNIQFDLTGGYDTRVVIALLLSANVDLEKIEIRSFNDGTSCHSEDFEIASAIAQKFNFKLNNRVIGAEKVNFKDINTPILLSSNIKLGFHNQLNYKFWFTKEPVYNFSGFAIERIRADTYDYATSDQFIKFQGHMAKMLDSNFEYPTLRIHYDAFEKLSEEFNVPIDSPKITNFFYSETRCRIHCGKTAVEEFFSNKLLLLPGLDPQIHKLKRTTNECDDTKLLITLIYVRYCPELLNFKFEKNRDLNNDTIEFAKKINKIKPFIPKKYDFISGPDLEVDKIAKFYPQNDVPVKWEEDGEYIKWNDVDNYLKNIFKSIKFKKEFEKYFSPQIYDNIVNSFNQDYFPLENSFPPFSILKVIHDIEFSKYNNTTLENWLESYEDYNNSDFNFIIDKIEKTDLFDENFYVKQLNIALDIDPLSHYLRTGYKYGLNPSKQFDGNYYLQKYPDVKNSGLNPLIHIYYMEK